MLSFKCIFFVHVCSKHPRRAGEVGMCLSEAVSGTPAVWLVLSLGLLQLVPLGGLMLCAIPPLGNCLHFCGGVLNTLFCCAGCVTMFHLPDALILEIARSEWEKQIKSSELWGTVSRESRYPGQRWHLMVVSHDPRKEQWSRIMTLFPYSLLNRSRAPYLRRRSGNSDTWTWRV